MSYSTADIRRIIASLPRVRSVGVPFESRAGCIVLFADTEELKRDGAQLRNRFEVPPLYTALDLPLDLKSLSNLIGADVVQLDQIKHQVGRELVVNVGRSVPPRTKLRLTRAARSRGREVFFYSENVLRNLTCRPKFFANNGDKVAYVANVLADEESLLCYLSRVKSLMFGDPGYIRLSKYKQYVHPTVSAEPGDVVCEGGVGGTANTTLMLARMCGPAGSVYAFEPVKSLFGSASDRVRNEGNIVLENKGLWSEPAEMTIRLAEQVSTFMNVPKHRDKDTEICELTSIDAYFSQRTVRPTLIKLDVEGAEQKVLAGAQNVIRENRPKLQVCLYHSIEDFLDVPIKTAEANLGYRIYIGHHTPFMNECLMYATAAKSPSVKKSRRRFMSSLPTMLRRNST